ncbi:MAG: GNAT family N-acetyltransferase [Candidatus Krumholzibacteriota bacterium]|nr:GNAT family N-acetyltransferase [Candidatus Krumholzibacteriota bacterium]
MTWIPCPHPDRIRRFARRDPLRFAFHLGDLDPVQWEYTEWFALAGDAGEPGAAGAFEEAGGEPDELLLVYRGLVTPCVQAFGREGPLGEALAAALPLLPGAGFLHGERADLDLLAGPLRLERRADLLRMAWRGFPAPPDTLGAGRARRLDPADVPGLLDLLGEAYPGTHFEPVQLLRAPAFGVEEDGRLVACAGLHVLSEAEGVAMLGNVATRPDRRGEGLARAATAALLAHIAGGVDHVGLNVRADNAPGRALYRRLGFTDAFPYQECAYSRASRDSS